MSQNPQSFFEWIMFFVMVLVFLWSICLFMKRQEKSQRISLFRTIPWIIVVCSAWLFVLGYNLNFIVLDKLSQIFIYAMVANLILAVSGVCLLKDEDSGIVVFILSCLLLAVMFLNTPETAGQKAEREQLEQEYQQELKTFESYLLWQETDGDKSWWIHRSDGGLGYMLRNEADLLKIISAVEGREVTDIFKWWFEEGGVGKMRVHFTVKLKDGPPPTLEEIQRNNLIK